VRRNGFVSPGSSPLCRSRSLTVIRRQDRDRLLAVADAVPELQPAVEAATKVARPLL
jgi:hypothetical protein